MAKRGRKPIAVNKRRVYQIGIYVTRREHKAITQLVGDMTISDYGRKLLLRKVR
jgi:hypothetical protein